MGKTNFIDGDPVLKTVGTRVMAAFLNLVFNHRHDGGDADGSAPLDFSDATGTPNAIVAAMTPALGSLTVGMPIYVRALYANTDAVTVTVDGFGPHALHKLGGRPLTAGDIQGNQIVQIAWDGVNFQLVSFATSPVPAPVTDAVTLQGQDPAMLSPPGMKGEFFLPTMPDGWLPCDGRLVLRAQYPNLFAAIGTFWGAGDNVITFNLPEVRGEYFRAWDNDRGIDHGRAFGSWQADQVKAHTHPSSAPALLQDSQSGGDSHYYGALGNSGSFGGDQNNVRNIALFVGIKY